jgi:acyl-CoA synthetase (AMP-forming)/AMP-acid ligase II
MTPTVYELLDRRASIHPDRLAFRFPHHQACPTLTYAALRARSCGLAAVLAETCAPGDRALIVLDTGPEFIVALFACFRAGVVAVAAAATAASREALARNVAIAADCQPRCIVRDADHATLADAIAAGAGLEDLDMCDPLSAACGDRGAPVVRHELAALQYTSGSTGRPKGVRLTHGNLLHNARAIGLAFDLDDQSVGVGWLPLSHDMGLVGNVIAPMYWNFPVHLMPPSLMLRRPDLWLRAISDSRATISGGPPAAYALCVDRIADEALDGVDLSTWRVAYVGSEPIPAQTLDRFASHFERHGFSSRAFVPCYGLAEATLFAAGRRVDEPPTAPVLDRRHMADGRARESAAGAPGLRTVAIHLPPDDAGIELRIVDPDNGRELADDAVGEICVGGASITPGYFTSPVSAAVDGLLRTGDAGFRRGDMLHVLGRWTDAVGGPRRLMWAHEIEAAVRAAHPAMAENAAFTVPGEAGEELVIVQGVRMRDGQAADIAALTTAAERVLADQFSITPRAILFVPARRIRRTTSGKVQRAAMRDDYLRHASPGVPTH